MWYLQLGRKHNLSSWRAIQYSILSIFFFISVCRNKEAVFWKICLKTGNHFNITAAIWFFRRFLNKWIWKTRYYYFLYKPTKKGKRFLIWKSHVTMTRREAYICNEMQLKSFSYLLSQKQITPFSYQLSISFTHGLQHYCFLGQANLYRLIGVWQISRQIWTIFLVQKRFQLLGCKFQSIQERWQERVPTGPKSYNGRGKLQPVYAIEESAGQCSRKLC